MKWNINPGDYIERKVLQEQFGGRTQGGIGPSRKSPNVLLFSDPVSGERHGYFDGWREDDCFHYTGEGQRGDQRMLSGNASILRHRDEGRSLRLFQGARGTVQYVGEFELDAGEPWYETDAPESGGGAIRQVIVFRLRPIESLRPVSLSALAAVKGAPVERVPIEQQWTEKTFVDPARQPFEAERREAKLVLALRDFLIRQGHSVTRLKLLPEGEQKPLFCDLYDETDKVLVEAKGSATRDAVRMALGQLIDYGRFMPEATRFVLLPSAPRPDIEKLARSGRVGIIWPEGDTFRRVQPDELVG